MDKKNNHEKIYDKLSSLFNIRIKAQLKDSPLEFHKLLHIKNVVTENENYVIIFKGKEHTLIFKDRDELITNFIAYIEIEISVLEEEFEELNQFENSSMGIKYDDNEVYLHHETIGHSLHKLNQIRDRLIKDKASH
ncbi:hypothetical protein [Parapedobacter koreensis]|uniref:Uncharacterized protein n=1 Tax=Parapedobacter koreensis TaxID=332977 RepID=A0A1H7UAZ8_9SPHI|nr:hypothetical protein [Parapedobacter koreensis]SEL93914.1 hypothetical protein SAMN05421740_11459 [Parapedobacter koreensis]